jgi:uncharacterized protein
MANGDADLIETLTKEDEAFRDAREKHSEYAKQLDELEQKSFITPQDEVEIKILKKKKLVHKDAMEHILMQYRKEKGKDLSKT